MYVTYLKGDLMITISLSVSNFEEIENGLSSKAISLNLSLAILAFTLLNLASF